MVTHCSNCDGCTSDQLSFRLGPACRVQRISVSEITTRENPKLDRLLTCDIEELLAAITPMSADDCEHYARTILDRIARQVAVVAAAVSGIRSQGIGQLACFKTYVRGGPC